MSLNNASIISLTLKAIATSAAAARTSRIENRIQQLKINHN